MIERSRHPPPRRIYDWRHYLAAVQRKPGALRSEPANAIGPRERANAPFAELPPAFKRLQEQMLRRTGVGREMVDILALVLHHDEQAVLTAVELALSEGVATKTHVLGPMC